MIDDAAFYSRQNKGTNKKRMELHSKNEKYTKVTSLNISLQEPLGTHNRGYEHLLL